MNLPFLKKRIAPTLVTGSRRWLRRIMRGYRLLKETERIGLIADVKNELTNARFDKIDQNTSEFFLGAGNEKAELIVRQYLLTRIGGYGLNRALLYTLGAKGSSVVCPMPRVWQEVVAKHGFRVARIRCSLAWAGYIGLLLGYGVLSIAKEIYSSLCEIVRPHAQDLRRYVYFVALSAGNLPQPCQDGRSHDIITWYVRWKGRAENLDILCHGVPTSRVCNTDGLPIKFDPYLVPPLDTWGSLFCFMCWALKAIMLSAFDLIRGHWWHALLLAESAKATSVRLQKPDKLACDYMFNNSGWIYRPLWTYEAEKKGSRILFYFYSTNCENFKLLGGYPIQANSWQAVNWPMYLVWDAWQADFVRRSVGDSAKTEVVGSIWFHSDSIELPELPVGSVAVFDVQPHRSSLYQILGLSEEYFVPKVINQFLLDIHTVAGECQCKMVHKRKRNTGKMIHPKYENLVKMLAKYDNVIPVEPDSSAIRVVESCFAVISMPFTSTALLGREAGKPSIYYDPFGIVQKDDRAAHGIQVLCGIDELRDWLTGLTKCL